ncbi:MAG: hypothetical protein II868_01115 [Butyrivibrio sp.]|nr:hypothetical protein [Butyrivibrio sp.]
MAINPIGSVISNSRMGTRIPEELLGVPARDMRYDRTYSMDAIEPVSSLSRRVVAEGEAENNPENNRTIGAVADAVASSQGAGALALTYGGRTFAEMLEELLNEENARDTRAVTNALDLYRAQQMLSSFSSDTTANNLTTLGASGLSVLGLS